MVDQTHLDEVKNRLESERAKLMKELEGHSHIQTYEDEKGSNVDPDVQADEAAGFADSLAIAGALRDRVNEIDEAINKINMGLYGRCEKCKKPISTDALVASPARTHCVECQKELNK